MIIIIIITITIMIITITIIRMWKKVGTEFDINMASMSYAPSWCGVATKESS